MTDQEKLDLYNELLKTLKPDEVLALKFGLAETMGVKKHLEEMSALTKELEQERARAKGLVEALKEIIRVENRLANEEYKFLKGFSYKKEDAVESSRHHVINARKALADYKAAGRVK